MDKARNFLAETAGFFNIPADVLSGIPKMELLGAREFSIEPHKGLVEYDRDQIGIDTVIGNVILVGNDLTIKLMTRKRITVQGELFTVRLRGADFA